MSATDYISGVIENQSSNNRAVGFSLNNFLSIWGDADVVGLSGGWLVQAELGW